MLCTRFFNQFCTNITQLVCSLKDIKNVLDVPMPSVVFQVFLQVEVQVIRISRVEEFVSLRYDLGFLEDAMIYAHV